MGEQSSSATIPSALWGIHFSWLKLGKALSRLSCEPTLCTC